MLIISNNNIILLYININNKKITVLSLFLLVLFFFSLLAWLPSCFCFLGRSPAADIQLGVLERARREIWLDKGVVGVYTA